MSRVPAKSGNGNYLCASSSTSAVPRSPIMITLALVSAPVMPGMMEASITRSPPMPLTTTEAALRGVSYTSSGGYFAPARTPRAIVNLLYTHISTVGKDPEVIRRNQDGGRPMFLTPEETDAYMKKEVQRWTALLKESGIVPE